MTLGSAAAMQAVSAEAMGEAVGVTGEVGSWVAAGCWDPVA